MKKIRINELARELEIKAHEVLERLPELGVTEKKTHSSSIDEYVAIKLRRLYGIDSPDLEPEAEGSVAIEEALAPEEAPEEQAHKPTDGDGLHGHPVARPQPHPERPPRAEAVEPPVIETAPEVEPSVAGPAP